MFKVGKIKKKPNNNTFIQQGWIILIKSNSKLTVNTFIFLAANSDVRPGKNIHPLFKYD